MWETEMVLMPVPLRLVQQVAEYVRELEDGRIPSGMVPEVEMVRVPGQGEWGEAMVAELADAIPYTGVLALFDRCAREKGEWIIKSEVEEAMGISPIQLRNELGALSKLAKRTFGRVTWPVQYKKEQGRYFYRMDAPVTDWWIKARSSS
jgi:hypothetical protein